MGGEFIFAKRGWFQNPNGILPFSPGVTVVRAGQARNAGYPGSTAHYEFNPEGVAYELEHTGLNCHALRDYHQTGAKEIQRLRA